MATAEAFLTNSTCIDSIDSIIPSATFASLFTVMKEAMCLAIVARIEAWLCPYLHEDGTIVSSNYSKWW